MSSLAEAIAALSPWYIFSAALLLITIDVFVLSSEVLLWIGIALLFAAGGNALDLPPLIQLWSYPVLLISVLFFQRRISGVLNRSPDPYPELEAYVGQTGRLRMTESITDNAQFFQAGSARKVLESVGAKEMELEPTRTLITKVKMPDGKVLPAILDKDTTFKDGEAVEVIRIQSQKLIVVKRAQP